MSIASTRKVSGSPNAPSKADYYRRGGNGESFVENIDTTNNVLVNNNDSDNRGNRQDSPFQKQEEKNNRPEVSHSYLKHFYERNEIIEEVDELV